jgi:hypothetical protein
VIVFVASFLTGLVLAFVTEEPALGLIALVALLLAGTAILFWSERAGRS